MTDWYQEVQGSPNLGEEYTDWYREMSRGQQTDLEIQADVERRRAAVPELQESGLLAGKSLSNSQKAALSYITEATLDARELGQIITKNFPDIGMTETKDGRIFLTRPSGQLSQGTPPKEGYQQIITEINKPGMSKMDLLQGLGLLAMFYPAGAAASIPGRVAGAGATEAALVQAPQAAMGGEFNPEDVALTMGLGAAGEAAIPLGKMGVQALKQRKLAQELGTRPQQLSEDVVPDVTDALTAQRQLEKQTGIKARLFPGQLSMTPSALARQRILPQLEASAPIATRELKAQNQELLDLTTAVIEQNFPADTIINANKRIRDASRNYMKALKDERSEEFKKIYRPAIEEAEQANLIVPMNKTKNTLEYLKVGHRPNSPIRKFLDSIEAGLEEANIHLENGSNIRAMHNFKSDEITQKVYEFERRKGPMNQDQANMIAQIRHSLATDLRGASGGYSRAMDKYIEMTPQIENYEASLLGSVSKLTDAQLTNLMTKFFNPNLTNQEIISAKKVLDSVDPKAAQGLVAKWIDLRIGGNIEKVTDQGTDIIPNVPGAIYGNLFRNASRRHLLYRLLDPVQKQNIQYLETMLHRAGAGRAEGSSTAAFLQTLNNIKGRFTQLKDLIFRSSSEFQRTGDASFFAMKLRAMAKAAYDPQYADKFNSIIQAPKNSEEAPKLMTRLINEVEQAMLTTARASAQTPQQMISPETQPPTVENMGL